MIIYIGHPSSIDYEDELYEPLKRSKLADQHELIFPHEDSEEQFNSRSFISDKADIMIAEVSEPSTGLGIELGWADLYDVPLICVHKKEANVSSAVDVVSDDVCAYRDSRELIDSLKEKLDNTI